MNHVNLFFTSLTCFWEQSITLYVCNMLYISTSDWVLGTPNAGRNSHFQRFNSISVSTSFKTQVFCIFFFFSDEKRWNTVGRRTNVWKMPKKYCNQILGVCSTGNLVKIQNTMHHLCGIVVRGNCCTSTHSTWTVKYVWCTCHMTMPCQSLLVQTSCKEVQTSCKALHTSFVIISLSFN